MCNKEYKEKLQEQIDNKFVHLIIKKFTTMLITLPDDIMWELSAKYSKQIQEAIENYDKIKINFIWNQFQEEVKFIKERKTKI